MAIIEVVFAHEAHRHSTSLSMRGKLQRITDPISKLEIVKKNVVNIKQVINIAKYVWKKN